LVPDFFELLREFNIAFVFADTAGKWPYAEDLTANFVYCRLHGDTQLYTSGYSDRALDWWATRLKLWRKGQQRKNAKLVTAKRNPRSTIYSSTLTTTRKCTPLSMLKRSLEKRNSKSDVIMSREDGE
jgi:uncharacterized protein YecE (DUF72 family)